MSKVADEKSVTPPLETMTLNSHHSGEMIKDEHSGEELVVQESKITRKTQIVGAAITVGGFLFGYDIGVISGALIMKDFYTRFGGVDSMPTSAASNVTGLLSVGTLLGALAQGPVSDKVGRKWSMIIWAILFTLGAIIQTTFESSEAQFVIGRVIAGLGVGALSGLCPLYLGETAPPAVRGTIVSCYQLNIIFGIVVSYAITWGTSTRADDSSLSWRVPVGMQLAWGLLLITIMIFIPESPRWLIAHDRPEDARSVMADMRGIQLHPAGPSGELRGDRAMETEFRDMSEGIQAERAAFAGTNWLTGFAVCFSPKQKMWYRTMMGMMLQILQQLCGQNFYYYYGPTFFKGAGVELSPYAVQFLFGAVSLVCTVPALVLIEKIGRRKGLMIGFFGQGVCAFIVAFVGRYALAPADRDPSVALTSGQRSAGNAFIAFACIHLAFFSCFAGPIPWTALSELFPSPLRARAISLGSASNWTFNLLVGLFSNKVAAQYNSFIMLIFGSILFFSTAFTYLFMHELKGLTLEQVDELFASGVKPWNSAKWVPSTGNTNRATLGAGQKIVHRANEVA